MKAQKPTDRLPPFCPGCCEERVRWKTVSKNVEQEYRGDTFYVKADVSAWADCGFEIGTDEQAMAIVTATRNAYRQKQGLLSSEEIRERRKALGMS